jgi:hypothetical protein
MSQATGIVAHMANGEVPKGAGHAYEVGRRTLSDQMTSIDALDSKAGIIIAAGGVLAGFLLSRDSRLMQAPPWLAMLLVVSIFFSLATALFAFGTRHFKHAPSFDATMRLMTADADWLKWRFLRNIQESIAENHQKIEQKARFLTASIGFLLAAVAALGAYSIWVIFQS